ncbi:RNA ligase RtcB family protein [Rhodobacterales bacterium]|nr:RNA ligase RtcB family protein [Rhodobacterales bacterium]
MGTSQRHDCSPPSGAAVIHRFYSSASWIEGAAEDQLCMAAGLAGVSHIAAFPDLHPGKYGPVGSTILADRIYPQLIGNDIGCGMSVYVLDLPARKLRLDKAAIRLRALEGPWQGDAAHRLKQAGLAHDLHDASLGTIGGGNHFCELQRVGETTSTGLLSSTGLAEGDLVLMVHSGSRSLGTEVFGTVLGAFGGLDADARDGAAYLEAHDRAVAWASLNRTLVAERAAQALRCDYRLACDAPHNLIEAHRGGFLHRKGAAKADMPLVPLAGSRDALSYLLQPLPGNPDALASLAHGAGRKYDRRSMTLRTGKTRSERDRLTRTSFGGMVICEDRQLLVEEAPGAYKDPGQVVRDLASAGLAAPLASLTPLVTFKKAVGADADGGRCEKERRLRERRAER